jgi:hypothetical protein
MCIFRAVAAMISAQKSKPMIINLAKKLKALFVGEWLSKWRLKIQSSKNDSVFMIE